MAIITYIKLLLTHSHPGEKIMILVKIIEKKSGKTGENFEILLKIEKNGEKIRRKKAGKHFKKASRKTRKKLQCRKSVKNSGKSDGNRDKTVKNAKKK